MEPVLNGFKTTGSWSDVVEHCEKLSVVFKHILDNKKKYNDINHEELRKCFEEWKKWRPEANEFLSEEINERTSEHNAVDVKSEFITQKVAKAHHSFIEAVSVSNPNSERKNSLKTGLLSIRSIVRILVQSVESFVYSNIMTKVSPYYFDNNLISANIQQKRSGEYVFETNINNDMVQNILEIQLDDINEANDRWHIDVEADAKRQEFVNGVDANDVPSSDKEYEDFKTDNSKD